AQHFSKILTPKVANNAERLKKAYTGEMGEFGQEYDPKFETIANIVGMRQQTTDIHQGLGRKATDYSKDNRLARQILTSTLHNKGNVSNEQLAEAYNRSLEAQRRLHEQMVKYVKDARTLGLTDQQIAVALITNGGLTRDQARSVMGDSFIPYIPDRQYWRELATSIGGDEVRRRAEVTVAEYRKAVDEIVAEKSQTIPPGVATN